MTRKELLKLGKESADCWYENYCKQQKRLTSSAKEISQCKSTTRRV